ncbi:uncharacterized protein LOC119663059 [Teleopsis dalmanni]|uniref:uncharacterized protein LOC119663059 n=1 Tax=Teleopsis dalmanni TaxID=139649 RepID=UPI0018CE53D1|nr:uncharacterized protein LOC119663059 [Teleopsis dalmanni]
MDDSKMQIFLQVDYQAYRRQAQIMGNLPTAWCNISQPFIPTGVDYAGPFNVRAIKGRGHRTYKGWVCVEKLSNSRPLTALSDDPKDLSALTPEHFLIGRALSAVPESSLLNTEIGVPFQWKM